MTALPGPGAVHLLLGHRINDPVPISHQYDPVQASDDRDQSPGTGAKHYYVAVKAVLKSHLRKTDEYPLCQNR